jgi:peptide deformylase
MLPKVRLFSDPALRQKAKPYVFPDVHNIIEREELETFIDVMFQVMKNENGMGLAANQIGDPRAIFVLGGSIPEGVFINPEILEQSDEIDFEEGCLSIPGASGMTKRFNKVKLKYFTKEGTEVVEDFEGKTAIAIQHEMDHLEGKLYIDAFGHMKKTLILDKHRKFLKMFSRRK